MCVYRFFEFYIFVLTLPLPPKTVLKNGVVETNGLSFAIKIAMSGNKFLTTMITMMRRRRRRRRREGGKKGEKKGLQLENTAVSIQNLLFHVALCVGAAGRSI